MSPSCSRICSVSTAVKYFNSRKAPHACKRHTAQSHRRHAQDHPRQNRISEMLNACSIQKPASACTTAPRLNKASQVLQAKHHTTSSRQGLHPRCQALKAATGDNSTFETTHGQATSAHQFAEDFWGLECMLPLPFFV